MLSGPGGLKIADATGVGVGVDPKVLIFLPFECNVRSRFWVWDVMVASVVNRMSLATSGEIVL